jgi:type I restriction enzyme, S subunit
MESNYKRLGNFIREVDIRNGELNYKKLKGVNLQKELIDSVANVIDVDFSSYKVVKKNQFVCKLMSVGRDKRLPISLNEDDEPIIISSAYYCFENLDENLILTEYLKLCLFRPIFEKELWFISGRDVRGGITWNDFCNVEIPVPSIEEQEKIVRQYKIVEKRKTLLNKLNTQLLVTLDLLYNKNFGFFKDDIKNLTDDGYKKIELPKKWKIMKMQNKFNISIGRTPPREELEYFSYDSSDLDWYSIADMKENCVYIDSATEKLTKKALDEFKIRVIPEGSILLSFKMTVGRVSITDKNAFTNEAIANFNVDDNWRYYLFLYLRNFDFKCLGSTSSISTSINSKIVKSLPFIEPDELTIKDFNKKVMPIFDCIKTIQKEYDVLSTINFL